MDLLLVYKAVILGLVEGITEFLPVSSTGHLILTSEWLGFSSIPGNVFEIVIQCGAILAVCVVYRKKLLKVARTLRTDPQSRHFCLNILLAFLPAAIIGLLLHKTIKAYLFNIHIVALMLIAGGIAILLIERLVKNAPRVHNVEDFSPRLALLIGFIQAIAIIPGVSRSGATIMGALLAGADRKAAAEFSFFLAIPTLAAASFFDLYKNWGNLTAADLEIIGIGFIVSFLSALLIVEWMIGFVSKHGFSPFAYYRIGLGTLILVFVI